jgi:hypothetical protein
MSTAHSDTYSEHRLDELIAAAGSTADARTGNNGNEQLTFASPMEAIYTAQYIEQLFVAEQQWSMNRLAWLLVSQSFCITAYAVLVSTNLARPGIERHVRLLIVGIPLFGLITCIAVGLAVRAAEQVIVKLADERARLSRHLNSLFRTRIPAVGVSPKSRDADLRWGILFGALPRWLPWVLCVLWLAMLIL